MSLGQAAANAAVLALTRGVAVQDVDYSTLRDQLVRGGQIVSVAMVPAKASVPK